MGFRNIAAGLAGLATCSAAMAQGSFNFDAIPGIEQAPTVSVDVTPVMMGFFRTMAAEAGPGATDIFEGLRSIKLRVYHAADNGTEFSSFIQNAAGQLEGQGWQRLMAVQDEAANMQFHLQMTEENVTGMTIMILEEQEAIFINLDGNVSAATLGRIIERYDLQEMIGPLPAMNFPSQQPAANDGN
jgi:hypothetical protein